MRIDVVSIFPAMFAAVQEYGVVGRALTQGAVEFKAWNPRDFSADKHRNVDDRPYGGGPGMVMAAPPLAQAIAAAKAENAGAKVAYVSPQGRRLDHAGVMNLAARSGLIIVAGRYEGVDERVLSCCVDEEWSLGDYVLSGGELAAMVIIDAVVRQLPGSLGHEDSATADSFVDGLLDYPHYTRPEEYAGVPVPPVLLSGDHAAIRRWRLQQSLGRTWLRRPDLLAQLRLTEEQQRLLKEFQQEHAKQE